MILFRYYWKGRWREYIPYFIGGLELLFPFYVKFMGMGSVYAGGILILWSFLCQQLIPLTVNMHIFRTRVQGNHCLE